MIKQFNKKDFENVLGIAEFYGISIFGIESWQDRKYSGVRVYEDYNTLADNPA